MSAVSPDWEIATSSVSVGTTLSRFDYLAQLERHPQGLRMNALSRYLMVTGGNVTGLTDELEKDGFVAREADPDDRAQQDGPRRRSERLLP